MKTGPKPETWDECLNKFIKKHENKYDYSESQFIDNNTKIKIICPIHGEFWQTPKNHKNSGCRKCSFLNRKSDLKYTTEILLKKFKDEVNIYDITDYSKYEYNGMHKKSLFICKKHNIEYKQTSGNHLRNHLGCEDCLKEKMSLLNSDSQNDFIDKANKIHDFKYDYSLVSYKGSHEKVEIICPKHGKFQQLAYGHLQGKGCNKCISISNPELEIIEFLNENEITNISHNNREIINPYEIDIFLPDYNIGIEYNGLRWHSIRKDNIKNKNEIKNQHLKKTELCNNKNIQLFHIFENEWLNPIKKDIWKSMILNKINKTPNKIFARKCEIKELSIKEAKEFFENNHLQGYRNAKIKIGLFYDNILVSAMLFGTQSNNIKKYDYELVRFANKKYFNVIGGASKLLTYFRRNFKGTIISYANRRWSNGNLYNKLGFTFKHISHPNYFYWKNRNILYSRNIFQKQRIKYYYEKGLKEIYFYNENLTELENMLNNDYNCIFDSGNMIFIM